MLLCFDCVYLLQQILCLCNITVHCQKSFRNCCYRRIDSFESNGIQIDYVKLMNANHATLCHSGLSQSLTNGRPEISQKVTCLQPRASSTYSVLLMKFHPNPSRMNWVTIMYIKRVVGILMWFLRFLCDCKKYVFHQRGRGERTRTAREMQWFTTLSDIEQLTFQLTTSQKRLRVCNINKPKWS